MSPPKALFQYDFKHLPLLLPMPDDAEVLRVDVDQILGVVKVLVATAEGRQVGAGMHPPHFLWQEYAGIET